MFIYLGNVSDSACMEPEEGQLNCPKRCLNDLNHRLNMYKSLTYIMQTVYINADVQSECEMLHEVWLGKDRANQISCYNNNLSAFNVIMKKFNIGLSLRLYRDVIKHNAILQCVYSFTFHNRRHYFRSRKNGCLLRTQG